ncbi:hypothetical protein BJY04DRAFT_215081 [Aspergillus karnatakaensis]|uniref:uncharacterized protein n=1 Tax=Aspergillus karnatakaensis TaxID=1810916 RepID=UPI003CCCFFC1
MADPVSIIGTAGALANVIQIVSQTLLAIRDLQSDWSDADLTFLSLASQLSALRLALTKIQEMDESRDWRFASSAHVVDSLHQKQDQALDFKSKFKLVFGKKNIDDVQKLLEHQTNALTLLLTACNCKTGAEQKALLVRSSSRKVLRQINADTASLMVHRDTSSVATQMTENMSKLSVTFSFDREIFASSVYGRFFRGLTKRVVRSRPSDSTPRPIANDKTPRYSQSVLISGSNARSVANLLQTMTGEFGPKTVVVDLTSFSDKPPSTGLL